MIGFEHKKSFNSLEALGIAGFGSEIDSDEMQRVIQIRRYWDFYKGYHWEEIDNKDKPEVTINYCRAFCDKFVSFELGNSFSFSLGDDAETIVTNDNRTQFMYLEDVWEDNNQFAFSTELGVVKSVTGEAWVQVRYYSKDELEDPYNEYPEGRLRVFIVPTGYVFPEFDPHDKDILHKVTVMYPIEKVKKTLLGKEHKERVIYKQVWTKNEIAEYEGGKEIHRYDNKYGIVPFIQIKNISIPSEEHGKSDLEDVIPLNMEYNMKSSDISEIIDYHAAPVTIVYGAKIGNLEKGANKLWGGLPKDGKVENLEMKGDLNASNLYLSTIKQSMCEISGIPESCLGSSQPISNTSGVALQYANLPLIEKTRVKRTLTESGLERVNKLILFISLLEGLITNPNSTPMRDFFHNEVTLPDTLPKDTLLETQQITSEMMLGIEDREGALKRLGREDINNVLNRIDADMLAHPTLYGKKIPQVNSGMLNGEI